MPGSLSTADRLKGRVDVRRLHDWDVYQRSRQPKRRIPRRAYPAYFFDERWEADLFFYTLPHAGGRKIGLLVIDVFSRLLFLEAVESKKSAEVARKFEDILERLPPPHRPPRRLETDKGPEFGSPPFQTVCRTRNIRWGAAEGYSKARYAERAIRSLKRLLANYFMAGGARAVAEPWSSLLERAATNLNGRYHRSLGMAPNEVAARWREVQRRLVRRHRRPVESRPPPPPRFAVGDKVWVMAESKREKHTNFDRETDDPFKKHTYEVTGVQSDRRPYLYRLYGPGEKGRLENLRRRFYQRHLRPAGKSRDLLDRRRT